MSEIIEIKEEKPQLDDRKFEIICQHKDTCSTNLNQQFESYGCNTLEAKVPVIRDALVDQLQKQTAEQKLYHTLYYKSKSATDALDGRLPRTRNKVLKVIEINNELVISAGGTRDKSPVDPIALDDELQKYIEERDRLKANKLCDEQTEPISSVVRNDDLNTAEDMDHDLEEYMKEAARKRTQKKFMLEQTAQLERMDFLEEDFDNDDLDGN